MDNMYVRSYCSFVKLIFNLLLFGCFLVALSSGDLTCYNGQVEHYDDTSRCCEPIICSAGEESVICPSDKDPYASCRPCNDGTFMEQETNSEGFMRRCSALRTCSPLDKSVLVPGSKVRNTDCVCNNANGYYTDEKIKINPDFCAKSSRQCYPGETMDDNGDCIGCKSGTYKNRPGWEQCSQCTSCEQKGLSTSIPCQALSDAQCINPINATGILAVDEQTPATYAPESPPDVNKFPAWGILIIVGIALVIFALVLVLILKKYLTRYCCASSTSNEKKKRKDEDGCDDNSTNFLLTKNCKIPEAAIVCETPNGGGQVTKSSSHVVLPDSNHTPRIDKPGPGSKNGTPSFVNNIPKVAKHGQSFERETPPASSYVCGSSAQASLCQVTPELQRTSILDDRKSGSEEVPCGKSLVCLEEDPMSGTHNSPIQDHNEKRKKYRLRLCVVPLLCVHG